MMAGNYRFKMEENDIIVKSKYSSAIYFSHLVLFMAVCIL